jgi:hypothetical protein
MFNGQNVKCRCNYKNDAKYMQTIKFVYNRVEVCRCGSMKHQLCTCEKEDIDKYSNYNEKQREKAHEIAKNTQCARRLKKYYSVSSNGLYHPVYGTGQLVYIACDECINFIDSGLFDHYPNGWKIKIFISISK